MVYRIPAVFAEAPWSTQLSFYKRADRNVSTFSTLGIFEYLELAILEVCRVQALNSNSELIFFALIWTPKLSEKILTVIQQTCSISGIPLCPLSA